MRSKHLALVLLIFLLSSFQLWANEELTTESELLNEQSLTTVDEFHFSLALGIGEKTNPLVGGDDIPLYLVPSFRYYGEQFFFDNGDLGYSFYDNEDVVVSLLTRLNPENAYFSRWHPKNISVINPLFDSSIAEGSNEKIELDIADIKKRKWAIDAGLQLNWFISDNLSFTGQLLHDINSVYQGLNGKLEFAYQLDTPDSERLSIQVAAGLNWSSKAMSQYYYGINSGDILDKSAFYQAKSAVNPYAKLFASYQLNDSWQLILSLHYQALDSTIYNSPIVKEKFTTTSFIGVNYAF